MPFPIEDKMAVIGVDKVIAINSIKHAYNMPLYTAYTATRANFTVQLCPVQLNFSVQMGTGVSALHGRTVFHTCINVKVITVII